MRTAQLPVLAALAAVSACATVRPQPATSLSGAWRIIEVAAPDGGVNSTPQPSLYVFTNRHYNMSRLGGTTARSLMADTASRSTISDAEMRTVFMPYVNNAGTYTLNGSMLVLRPTISLWPNLMAGIADTSEVSVSGDTLRIAQRSGLTRNTRYTLLRQ